MSRTLVSFIAVIVPAATCGCHRPEAEPNTPVRLTPTPIPYFGDIPVPAGYTRVNERSMDVVAGPLRMARLVYKGRASLTAVRNFYGEQMPVGGWREVSRQFEEGLHTMRFEKQTESCEVKFSRQGALKSGTEITIVVTPRGQTQSPPGMQRAS